ncbi:heat shock protein Hsp20 [Sulfuricella denitrificans skB26]|uniref:Heat shock protein Hsp20 n=1 Tax=Sulfuricella denitrificans (strain DSM 22764 / NBRC 105220 / skB26) TaxID=1163617 RepID=S6B0D0_SULDS|nr:Hsp20/alpha crystallin family protein [Sulfuricella denitrificans]BAN34177.1 heat shock protein Hsp20 [Sulfuricella denitrificans skB26]
MSSRILGWPKNAVAHVTIEGNQISISAEVKKEKEEKEGDKVLRSERYYGKVYRSFSLGQDVD